MANEEYLEILRQGVEVWNHWKEENPAIYPDLTGANLVNFCLRKVNFDGVDLSRANLAGADLSDAKLTWTNLDKTNLQGVDLNKTVLSKIKSLENSNLQDARNIPEWVIQGLSGNGVYSQEHLIASIRNGFKKLSGANLTNAVLEGTDLSKADLQKANIGWANLRNTNLQESNLSEADLDATDLTKANLHKAILRKASLDGAILNSANLSGADLQEAFLGTLGEYLWEEHLNATLAEANLREARLSNTYLEGANLFRADLREADLRKAYLSGAMLAKANLNKANLREANLSGVNLTRANLSEANLSGANLNTAKLIHTNLSKAVITEVSLYGTARDNWIIDGIICDYVYWDYNHFTVDEEEKRQWKTEHRIPKNRNFCPGEFEELYKYLPTFDYYFHNGFTALDAVIMARVVEVINEQNPELGLKLDSFHSRGQARARFTVLYEECIKNAEQLVKTNYEARIAALEGKQDLMMSMFSKLVSEKYSISDGGDVVISLPLQQQIIRFLKGLPSIQDSLSQQAFLNSAGLDESLLGQINVNNAPLQFVNLLVRKCMKYGTLYDGRYALEAILDAAKQQVGGDKQVLCDQLIQQLYAEEM